MQWYRAYIGMAADPKFKAIAKLAKTQHVVVLGTWVAVLEHACAHDGSLDGLDCLDIACGLDVDLDLVEAVVARFHERGLIRDGKPAAWDARQFTSDHSATRVKRYRERKRAVTDGQCNVTSPLPDADETAKPPPGNAPEQNRSDQNQNREEKIEAQAAPAPPSDDLAIPDFLSRKTTPRQELETVLDAEHAQAVIEHRQRMRRPLTAHAAKLLAGKFSRARGDPNAAADAMISNGWQGFEPEWMERNGRNKPSDLDNRQSTVEAIDEVVSMAVARQRRMGA